jgi:hypothetical protein
VEKPKWMPDKDWCCCICYADRYGTDPYLLAAIGWHETHWGTLGWGRKGFHLGVGCYSETKANPLFQGLHRQLEWAAQQLGKFMGRNITQEKIYEFAKKVWRPGNPLTWATSVWRIYQDLKGGEKSA